MVYLTEMNAFSDKFPVEVKEKFCIPLGKRGIIGTVKNLNVPLKKCKTSKSCHNCSHRLSKYYYWKQSPCEVCSRSPMFYCNLTRRDLLDHWEASTPSSDIKKNSFRLETCTNGLDISLEPNSPRRL